MKPYVSIDLETTGCDPATCQILEVGAVIDDWVTPIEQLSRWHCYVLHDQIVGEPFALSMNVDLLRTIGERKKPGSYYFPDEIGRFFHKWLCGKGINTNSVVAAGKNFASFDLPFFRRLAAFNEYITFHHRCIDPTMLYWQPEIDDVPPSMEKCLSRMGRRMLVQHTAVDDAMLVVELIRAKVLPT